MQFILNKSVFDAAGFEVNNPGGFLLEMLLMVFAIEVEYQRMCHIRWIRPSHVEK